MNIERFCRTERRRIHELTEMESEVIYGFLLGDGSIRLSGRYASYVEAHCAKQRQYLEWKADLLAGLLSRGVHDRISKCQGKEYPSVWLTTRTEPVFLEIRKQVYIDGRRTVGSRWLEDIGELGLACWYFDCGSYRGSHSAYRITCAGRTAHEKLLLKNFLRNQFGIEAKIQKRCLWISRKGALALTQILRKYVVDCMTYKVMEKSRMRRRVSDYEEFVKQNWLTMTDKEIGAELGFDRQNVGKFRRSIGLRKKP